MFDIFDFNHATASDLQSKYKEIADRTKDDGFFTKKELQFLPSVLAKGEQVYAFSSGMMDGRTWLIVLTDRRIVFLNKKMFIGLEQASIPLEKVNEVGGSTGWILGKIEVEDGARRRVIENVPKAGVTPFTNLVRDAIEARKNAPQAPARGAGLRTDTLDALKRLAKLRDAGHLTQDEFEEQKRRVLA